eukprot:TRINITY_DN12435_c0_g1_i2.p1 TRINITY_DN12435_c0_g1~~TRINITY_DN12435_c0_g1_i2.p1  ORF type:complete len:131 (-),score=15.71 TRINITY_DN12435_c0_g1_i2:38-430(-)
MCIRDRYQSGGAGFVSRFPGDCIASFFSGTGLSGVLFNSTRLILLIVVGTSENSLQIGSIIYFAISTLFLLICFGLFDVFNQTEFAKHYMEKCHAQQSSRKQSQSNVLIEQLIDEIKPCLLYTSPSPRDS